MVLLESTDMDLGRPCPDFDLRSVDGRRYRRDDFRDRPVLVVLFICNHCPYVQAVEDRIIELAREYGPRGAQLVGICSNDPSDYPDDAPERLFERWREKGYGFPYLVDESQGVAREFGAVCTPDVFVYDAERRLAYHGRIDDSWKDPVKVRRRELAEALDELLAAKRPAARQEPSMGCSIKWRKA
ncbi:MAG TPA: thioredoxin family protein [Candidatus Binatia bacterium]|nr:thioredoxin family protein [Candidatus Binatia bacterium]